MLCLACVAWVVYRMAGTEVVARLTTGADARRLWVGIGKGCALYAAAVSLLGVAWFALLRALGATGVSAPRTLTIYSVSQFGKYLPGSVFQYLGRHAMLRAHDVSHRLLVLCAVLEAAMLIAAALIFAAPMATHYVAIEAPVIWAAVGGGLLCMGWVLRRYASSLGAGITLCPSWLATAFLAYLAFFALMGLTFRLVAGDGVLEATGWTAMLAAVAGSWIAGFLVIGAPAGVGVREAVFLALFGALLGEQTTLVSVSAFRLATFGGDLLVLLVALPFAVAGRRRINDG